MTIQGMSLRSKLITMTGATIVALAILFSGLLYSERNQLLADRHDKIRNLVEVAHSTLAFYDQQTRDGKMSIAEAQSAAMGALRQTRYDQSEYFWINDLSDVMVMHPIKPELEGKKLDKIQDKNGKFLFVEFNRTVKDKGAGFVDYLWPKPGSESAVPKISYVKGFTPWGWVVGSGIYVDDVEAKFREAALRFLAWGVIIGGIIAVSLALLSRNIIRTLGGEPAVAAEITRRIAAGDLTVHIPSREGDDTSLLAGIRTMRDTLRRMIGEITANAEQVATASSQLQSSSLELLERAQTQSDAASSIAAAVEQMAVSIDQVKDNARVAYNLSNEAGEISEMGTGVIHGAANEMHKISQSVQSSSNIVQELGQQSDRITSIVNTIREIADQTNLLALNAAIEAARAGEQGRGFAVVADEVRKLAERTSSSTTEITEMVGKIQSGTQDAVSSMRSGVSQVSQGVELANQAGDAINRIRDGARRVTEMVNGIGDAIVEQSSASAQIAQRIEQIALMSEQSAVAVQQTTNAAQQLESMSNALHSAVRQFKTI